MLFPYSRVLWARTYDFSVLATFETRDVKLYRYVVSKSQSNILFYLTLTYLLRKQHQLSRRYYPTSSASSFMSLSSLNVFY